MKIIEYKTDEYNKTIEKIAKDIFFSKVISFFGAGLTIGETTGFGKTVPSGNEFKKLMKTKILTTTDIYPEDELDELEFYELSSIFFEIIDEHNINIKHIFKELFTNIQLDETSNKYKFLNLNWKTIYTLNIDDAIENCSIHNTIITPDIDINHDYLKDYKSVIKLHGDAKKNILDNNNSLSDTIVFSKEIYIKALLENQLILSYFVSEISRLNTIFYGCSFEALELDIEGIMANAKNEISENPNLYRYFVTTSIPTKQIKLRKLEKEFLITHIIDLKERENYDNFLQDVINKTEEIKNDININLSLYAEFELNVSVIEKSDRSNNIKFLLGLESIYEYSDYSKNIFTLPSYTISREIRNNFISSFSNNTISVLKGPKISGKTTFLLDTFKDYVIKKVYFIASTIDISVGVLEDMIHNLPESIIILDSSSFMYEHLWMIKRNLSKLQEQNSNIILTFNSNDNTTFGSFNSIFKDKKIHEYKLDNIFTNNELKTLNYELDSIPLPNFINQVKSEDIFQKTKKQNILDNIIRVNMTAYTDKEYINWEKYKITKVKEFTLLFILSTLNKFNLSSYYVVYGGMKEIKKIVDKFSPFIEEQYLSRHEEDHNSGTKIVSNSQVSLTYILAKSIEEQSLSVEDITDELARIIGKLYNNKINKYQELLFFDNLKENLHNEHKKYFQEIVIKLYTNLEKELTEDNHYWLQRAKSILYMQSDNINAIKDGLRFSTKVYTDEISSHSKISGYAAHISAMLYGRLITLEKYKNIENVESAIFYYYTILEEFNWNTTYIKKMIKRSEKNDLQNLCYKFIDSCLNSENREKLKIIRQHYTSYHKM